ncbi:MAG: hypothetical protein IBX48_04170 [Thiomicrospira sp.]|uniref:hypothetical protein n=1 Tax=Thiomicrospira sp. TaxID=935 RepID=UPI001A012EA3|nr:hypothetical protein [Thiomicrospira sp.]MBE0493517.1 hypothetical protein [Thiomicrospira sp.]
MKSYRFSLFLILSLLFVQTLSITHAVAHPFHADAAQADSAAHSHAVFEIAQASHSHDQTGIDDWVCELFDSVPNTALENKTNSSWLMAEALAPGLVVPFTVLIPPTLYPSNWSRAPPILN